jgi:hypothetical protein
MLIFSSYVIVLLIITGLVSTTPIKKISLNEKSENVSLNQAFRQAEMTLNRYFYLMKSDTDHLVHGLLHVLINNPLSFPYIPHRALNIAFKNVEQKLGHDDVDILTKPFLLALDQNYQSKPNPSPFKLTEETKEKIEEALDKFLDEAEFDSHL